MGTDGAPVIDPGRCVLTDLVAAMPDKASSVLLCRRGGARTSVPYPECHRDALSLAAALRRRGVAPGTRVAVHGATSYEWVLADLAALLTGAVSVALYPSAPPERAVATAREAGCRTVLTDRADCVAAFRAAGLDVVFLGPEGEGAPSVVELIAEAAEKGEDAGAGAGAADFAPADRGDGPFTIVSTSGTLSEPKLFAVHSAPLLHTMDHFAELYGFDGRDRLLVYLPLSHLPQRMMLYWGLGQGLDFVLSDPARVIADGVETSPTLHVAVPRSLQHLHKRALDLARRQGLEGEEGAMTKAYAQVFGTALKAVFVGSAPSDPALLAELHAGGVPVYEVYGTTELGMVGLNVPDANRRGTVGRPIPWGDVRIDDESGEVLVRTPTPFRYGEVLGPHVVPVVRNPDAWWPTGDAGALDADGFLTVHGRLRDFVALPNGEKVFLRALEESTAAATGAGLCVVMKIDASHLGALLFFDPAAPEGVGSADGYRARLAEANRRLHPWERIHSFAVVSGLPSLADGCMTETTKLRRHKVEETYGAPAQWLSVRE
ncbi:AMP-binding protein [Streptomyces sp. NPDC048057]|uniref:AMP-binding protein n=1 Tax=Streptomyces sp. NPDC048057 TaxID=3155628 RepID=UPI0033EDB5E7